MLNGGVKVSVVWDPKNERFITIDHLSYLARQMQLEQSFREWLSKQKGKWFRLEEPSGYGSRNKVWGEIQIQEVQEIPYSSYIPVIPILAEPRVFMALVPADRSLEILRQIKLRYEREMGKVRNRLPLHLGAVYFSRRTPLRAALDAGQAMLRRKMQAGSWRVTSVENGSLPEHRNELAQGTDQFKQTITITLERDGYTIVWHVPAVMGDGITPDNWYPYVYFVEDANGNIAPTDRQRIFTDREKRLLVHAGDLQVGDYICFVPSTFDFEFLDTTSRRFEIYYGDDGRRASRRTRPFYLEDLDRLERLWGYLKQLTPSQRHQIVSVIEATREVWYGADDNQESLNDPVFKQFVADTLAGAEWLSDVWQHPEARDALILAGARGELADLLELRMEILKERDR